MAFTLTDAIREKIAMLVVLYGPTGSGKTKSAMLLAAGLAGPNGVVGMLDTENKRGSLYADDPDILKAMPGGRPWKRLDMGPPYTPARYIEALKVMEDAGITVAVIDSTTHEWSGEDGCCDIAEKNKLGGSPNWAKAKLAHKRFVSWCLSSSMHIVFCLRAHEKSKPVKAGDLISPDGTERYERSTYIAMGMLPDTEKNLVFEALISLRIDEGTHFAKPVKVPGMLAHVFPGGRMVTAADGEAIRQWNEGGRAQESGEQLRKRARIMAEDGQEAYRAFFTGLKPAERAALKTIHEEYKLIAEQADAAKSADPAAIAEIEGGGKV